MTASNIIKNANLISERAAELNCSVLAILDTYILCQRADATFITWRVSTLGGQATFSNGNYDMDKDEGYQDLLIRAGLATKQNIVLTFDKGLASDDMIQDFIDNVSSFIGYVSWCEGELEVQITINERIDAFKTSALAHGLSFDVVRNHCQ